MRPRGLQWRQWLLGVLLLIVAFWLGSLIIQLAGKAQIAWREEHQTENQYTSLEARKAALQSDLDALNTSRGQDAAIREAFSVARSGEGVIIVVPPSATSTATSTPWWRRFFSWF